MARIQRSFFLAFFLYDDVIGRRHAYFFLYDERLFGITTYNLKRHYFLKCHNTHTHTHTHTYIYINMALTSMLSATKVYFRISSRFAVLFCFVFS